MTRHGLGLGAAAIGLGLVACPRNGGVEGSLAVISPDEVVVSADAAPPPAAGRCPQDAPWNGRVCLGHGYVACPGGATLDDAGTCQASANATPEVLDAAAAPVDAAAPPEPRRLRGRH